MKKTPKEELEAEVELLCERARQADAVLEGLQRDADTFDAEVGDATIRDDKEKLAKLLAGAVERPIRLHAARVSAKAIAAERDKKSAELSKINDAERQAALTKDLALILGERAAEVGGEVGRGMEIIGHGLRKYDRLADEVDAIRAQLATLGQQARPLPPWTQIVERQLEAFRPRTMTTVNVIVPVLIS